MWIMLLVTLLGPGVVEVRAVGAYDTRSECEEARLTSYDATVCVRRREA